MVSLVGLSIDDSIFFLLGVLDWVLDWVLGCFTPPRCPPPFTVFGLLFIFNQDILFKSLRVIAPGLYISSKKHLAKFLPPRSK